ncbi:hypothetical protein WP50_09530 [Lactiplantibacillus plantarum]|nr:hypothetical protein WP50_09530 [Lactiplantibacillus plantarum]
MVQRPLNFAIIDEVDSILIDEARTPLIISGQSEGTTGMYKRADRFAKTLTKDEDYKVDLESKTVALLDSITYVITWWSTVKTWCNDHLILPSLMKLTQS